jgi:hypothetical protein
MTHDLVLTLDLEVVEYIGPYHINRCYPFPFPVSARIIGWNVVFIILWVCRPRTIMSFTFHSMMMDEVKIKQQTEQRNVLVIKNAQRYLLFKTSTVYQWRFCRLAEYNIIVFIELDHWSLVSRNAAVPVQGI